MRLNNGTLMSKQIHPKSFTIKIMKITFKGTREEYKSRIESSLPSGTWNDHGGTIRYVTNDGSIIDWWESTGTVSPTGKRIDEMKDHLGLIFQIKNSTSLARDITINKNNKIFIVHGHDIGVTRELELMLHKAGLDPNVLMDKSADGKTILELLCENIENHENCFGIVLMTPDDIGYPKDHPEKSLARARQNVVLELGMLLMTLGRERVAVLKKGELELPSDIDGLRYLPFKEKIQEQGSGLFEMMSKCGINIPPENLFKALKS
jgi:predicted nucleotide-binding protein